MSTYAQINVVPHGSTGAALFRTQAQRAALGDDCWALWGRGRAAENDHEYNFGTKVGVYADAALTRLDDRAGFHSKGATRRLLAKLDEIGPDIVHLHNLHGYYVNVEMLFAWLAARRCEVLWTLHDCWAFTGHCASFSSAGCYEWKTGCPGGKSACPQKRAYPKTLFAGSCAQNYHDKRCVFTSLPSDRLTLIAPSGWLASQLEDSFLAKYRIEVRRNEVDETVFKPTPSDFRERYGLEGRFVIMGAASPWTESKGLSDFVQLRARLGNDFAIVLVGLSKKQIKALPEGVLGLGYVGDAREMAALYTAADALFQPSRDETFGMTIAEASACGTRVLVYAGGACEETARFLSQHVASDFEEAVEVLSGWGRGS